MLIIVSYNPPNLSSIVLESSTAMPNAYNAHGNVHDMALTLQIILITKNDQKQPKPTENNDNHILYRNTNIEYDARYINEIM
jgi:hypothetical protein